MQAAQVSTNQPKQKQRKRHTFADPQKIVETATLNPNLSQTDIAKLNNIDNSTVCKILAKYGIDRERVEHFKANRADILAGLQEKLLISIQEEDIKKAPLGTRVLASCQLFDKERLERDLSTSNTQSIFGDIAALKGLKPVDK